ncbi:MAG TPA: serine protease, partial [Isosphaeraceae bacterium]|nr:serine protease [Isosphaeraceae bacterium]
MMRPFSARLSPAVVACWVGFGLSVALSGWVFAQNPAPAQTEGQFFTIEEPITTEVINRVRNQTRHFLSQTARKGNEQGPILIFEIRPGRSLPGQSDFGAAHTLADFISTELEGGQTVAFVPEPISGYVCLVALACDEIVMASQAAMGPITPEGQTVKPLAREEVHILAKRKGYEEDLLLGMLDRDARLLRVTTGDRQVHHVLADKLETFRQSHQVSEQALEWEGGQRGILTGERARSEGFCKRNADNRSEVANIYNLTGKAAADDPTLDQVLNPVWIRIAG